MYSYSLSRHLRLATLTSIMLGTTSRPSRAVGKVSFVNPKRDPPQAEEEGRAEQGSYLDGRHSLPKRPSPTPRAHEEPHPLQPDRSLLRRTPRVAAKAWGPNMISGRDSISSLLEKGRLDPGGQLVL